MKQKPPSFRERIRRMEVIADRVDALANGATPAAAGLRDDGAFLRQEALRMTDILARLVARDDARKVTKTRR